MSFTDLSYTGLTDKFFKETGFERLPADKPNDFWIIDLGSPPPFGNEYVDTFFNNHPTHWRLIILLNAYKGFTEKHFNRPSDNKPLILIKMGEESMQNMSFHSCSTIPHSVLVFNDFIPATELFQSMKSVVRQHLALKTVYALKLREETLDESFNVKNVL